MSEGAPEGERSQQIASVLPQEAAGYFEGLNKQHFGADTVGSRFTEVDSLQDLLGKRYDQEGTIEGDDRTFLAGKGSPESAFAPSSVCRYIKVMTPGKMGVRKVTDLADDTPIKVLTVPGKGTCSLVVEVDSEDELEDVDYGTIIIGGNSKRNESDPEPSTKEMVWTAHPGFPTPPPFSDKWADGETITAADVKAELGDDFFVSMKVKSAE